MLKRQSTAKHGAQIAHMLFRTLFVTSHGMRMLLEPDRQQARKLPRFGMS